MNTESHIMPSEADDPSMKPLLEIPARKGPNGCSVWVMADLSIAERNPSEEEPDEIFYDTLVRSYAEILDHYYKARRIVWYHRHQARCGDIEESGRTLSGTELETYNRAQEAAARIEATHDASELDLSEFELGLANGRMSALAWASGTDWEVSLDT